MRCQGLVVSCLPPWGHRGLVVSCLPPMGSPRTTTKMVAIYSMARFHWLVNVPVDPESRAPLRSADPTNNTRWCNVTIMFLFLIPIGIPLALFLYGCSSIGQRRRHMPDGISRIAKTSDYWNTNDLLWSGPPTSPFLGNLLHIPSSKAFLQYEWCGDCISSNLNWFTYRMSEWAKRYGDVYSLTVGPSNIIVLSGRRAVKQVLDKKSAVSSDQPTSLLR